MDELWVPSEWGVQQFVAAGVPAHKVHVLPEPVDTDTFDPLHVPNEPQSLPGSGGDTFAFLSVFKWEDRKGWDVLLEAFLSEFRRSDNVILFVRSGANDAKLHAAVIDTRERLGLSESEAAQVTWVAHASVKDYPKLFRAANAFVLPTHGEGWGRPLAEAMSMGLPAIAPAWGGQTAFMRDNNSYLVPVHGLEPAYPSEPHLLGHGGGPLVVGSSSGGGGDDSKSSSDSEDGQEESQLEKEEEEKNQNQNQRQQQKWASIAPSDLAKAMRYIVRFPHEAQETGRRARAHITRYFSREAVADLVEARMANIFEHIRATT